MDFSKMGAIMKHLVPINVFKVKNFVGASQYLRKFIASFSIVAKTLHTITKSGKSFLWGRVNKGPLRN